MNFEKRRLHPLGMLLAAIKIFKEISLPLLILLITQVLRQELPPWSLSLAAALVLAIIGIGALSWYRFTYSIIDGNLLVEHGVLVRSKAIVPRERVQSVDFNQGILQRIFGLVSVQVETAGGQKPEAVLVAVTRQDARELRQILLDETLLKAEDRPAEHTTPQKQLGTGSLLLFGATSGSGLGIVLAIFSGLWATLDDIGLEMKVVEFYQLFLVNKNVAMLIAVLLVFLWLLSILGMTLKYGGFKLTRSEDRIQVVYGLLHRRQASIPVRRIQAVRLTEGMLRQPWGLLSLQVESAGYGSKSAEKALVWPLLRQKDLPDFLSEFLPEFTAEIPLQSLPPGTARRYALRALLPTAPVAMVLILLLYRAGFTYPLLPMMLPIFATAMALWNHRDAGWGLRGNMLALRYRLFSRTRVITPRRCVQSLTTSDNPWQRRAGLTTFHLDLASGARFGLMHIAASHGKELGQWLESRAISGKIN